MLKIRFQKRGKKNSPMFRIVVAEQTSPPKGKFIEIVGNYNPFTKKGEFKADRIKHWISKGAQLTPSVNNLLIANKIIEGEKMRAWKPRRESKQKKEAVEPAAEGEIKIGPEETEKQEKNDDRPEGKVEEKEAKAAKDKEAEEEKTVKEDSDKTKEEKSEENAKSTDKEPKDGDKKE